MVVSLLNGQNCVYIYYIIVSIQELCCSKVIHRSGRKRPLNLSLSLTPRMQTEDDPERFLNTAQLVKKACRSILCLFLPPGLATYAGHSSQWHVMSSILEHLIWSGGVFHNHQNSFCQMFTRTVPLLTILNGFKSENIQPSQLIGRPQPYSPNGERWTRCRSWTRRIFVIFVSKKTGRSFWKMDQS